MKYEKAGDSIGRKYDMLKITGIDRLNHEAIAICDCDCGKTGVRIRLKSIKNSSTKSCGCYNEKYNYIKPLDITNQKFDRLTAIRDTGEIQNKSHVWECICDCKKIRYVPACRLTSGEIRSCGCLLSDFSKENGKQTVKTIQERYIKDGTNTKLIEKTEPQPNNILGHRNISFRRGKYIVTLRYKNKRYNFGGFKSLEYAIKIRDEARRARLEDRLEEYVKQYKS